MNAIGIEHARFLDDQFTEGQVQVTEGHWFLLYGWHKLQSCLQRCQSKWKIQQTWVQTDLHHRLCKQNEERLRNRNGAEDLSAWDAHSPHWHARCHPPAWPRLRSPFLASMEPSPHCCDLPGDTSLFVPLFLCLQNKRIHKTFEKHRPQMPQDLLFTIFRHVFYPLFNLCIHSTFTEWAAAELGCNLLARDNVLIIINAFLFHSQEDPHFQTF